MIHKPSRTDKAGKDKPVHNLQDELNRILDKIGTVGYSRLTKKEKEFLKKYGDLIDNENNAYKDH